METRRHRTVSALIWAILSLSAAACGRTQPPAADRGAVSDGPADTAQALPQRLTGNAASGREVYRFETFGNEKFWTDALRLPQGMEAVRFMPKQALEAGLQVDVDAVPTALRATTVKV